MTAGLRSPTDAKVRTIKSYVGGVSCNVHGLDSLRGVRKKKSVCTCYMLRVHFCKKPASALGGILQLLAIIIHAKPEQNTLLVPFVDSKIR